MSGALRPRGAIARGMFAVALLVSLVVLFAPGPDVPSAPPGVDKIVHASLFAVLALTGRWAGVGQSVLAGLLLVYAAASELLQGIPALQRDPAVGDWLADAVGVLLGLLVWAALTRRRSTA